MKGYTKNTQVVEAAPEAVFRAFLEAEALATWLAPGDMTAKVHRLDARVGGGYGMSLFYSAEEPGQPGKTAEKEDRFEARFVEIVPHRRIVEAIRFDSQDPAFQGEMGMVVTLEPQGKGTLVTLEFKDIPPGIKPEDNEYGTGLSLEKLAGYLKGR